MHRLSLILIALISSLSSGMNFSTQKLLSRRRFSAGFLSGSKKDFPEQIRPQKLLRKNNIGSEHVEVVKKSKFVVKVSEAVDFNAAMKFIEHYKDSKASHNCWAYRKSESSERSSDDGEPSGFYFINGYMSSTP